MTDTLYIGDPAYSSWSLRGWLLYERFGIKCKIVWISFQDRNVAAQLAALSPARTVPAVLSTEGAVISESLAIAEELASRHPEAGHWPRDPKSRATARCLAAEMHAGFTALRNACPMALRVAYTDYQPSEEVLADIARLEQIWAHARKACGSEGPWLCGDYSAADAFFAPVAARIATYGLPVSDAAADYVAAHLADPTFRRWRGIGMVKGADLPWYAKENTRGSWPGPEPLPENSSETDACGT